MIRALALALALLAGPAAAGPDRLALLLGSRHLGAAGYVERNPGLFLTWGRAGREVSLGAYVNSYGRGSVAATLAVPLWRWQGGAVSLFAGAAYYPGHGRTFGAHWGDLVPLGGLQIRAGARFIQIQPMDGRPVRAVVSFGITRPLGRSHIKRK